MFLVAFETFIAEGHYCRGTLLQGAVVAVEHCCQQLSTQRVVVVGVVIAGRRRCKGLSLERVINNHWRLQRDVVAGRHHCRATLLQGVVVAVERYCKQLSIERVVVTGVVIAGRRRCTLKPSLQRATSVFIPLHSIARQLHLSTA